MVFLEFLAELIFEFVWHVVSWRFVLCLVAGMALALGVASHIAAEPPSSIAVGAVIVAALALGWRGENRDERS